VTIDPPEPVLHLVRHERLVALYRILGSLHYLSATGRGVLKQSLADGGANFPPGVATVHRTGLPAPPIQWVASIGPPPLSIQIPIGDGREPRQCQVQPAAARSIFDRSGLQLPERRWLLFPELMTAGAGIRAFRPWEEVLSASETFASRDLGMTPRPFAFQMEPVAPTTALLAGEPAITLDPSKVALLFLQELNLPETLTSFRIEKFLGAGSVTASFLARHVDSQVGRPAVLKFLLPPFSTLSVTLIDQYLGEIQWLPGVLLHEDVMFAGGHVFIVQKYMHGNLSDLSSGLSGSKRLALAVHALADVCEALALVHDHGVAHGRISLTNILFDGRRFWLSDFHSVHLPEMRATPATEEDRQTDIKELGHVLTEMMADQPLAQPEWLAEVIAKCTAESPHDRPSAADILSDVPYGAARKKIAVLSALQGGHRRDQIHYTLDLGGERVVEVLSQSLGTVRVRDLCTLWDDLEDIAWDTRRPFVETQREIDDLFAALKEIASRMVLGPELHARLCESLPLPLWIISDPEVAAIPWELLTVKGRPLCQWLPMSRSPRLLPESRTAARPQTIRSLPFAEEIRVLLIADLSGNLPGTVPECKRIREELSRCCLADRLRVEVVDKPINILKLLKEIERSHVIHFAGHVKLSAEDPAESALILNEGERIRAGDLSWFWNEGSAPLLFFANGCASGRAPRRNDAAFRSNAAMGLAHAFLAAGVGSYVGTAWEIPDDLRSADFASAFYRHFFAGDSAGRSLLRARDESLRKRGWHDLTWARYILFGHPMNGLELTQRRDSW
jgi:hypothetical protein